MNIIEERLTEVYLYPIKNNINCEMITKSSIENMNERIKHGIKMNGTEMKSIIYMRM